MTSSWQASLRAERLAASLRERVTPFHSPSSSYRFPKAFSEEDEEEEEEEAREDEIFFFFFCESRLITFWERVGILRTSSHMRGSSHAKTGQRLRR